MLMYYHQLNCETSLAVDSIIAAYISRCDPPARELPTKRMGRPRLRDISIRLGYQICGGNDWREIIPVCAAFELENSSSYVINWIFDKKGGAATERETNNRIVAGMQLREMAHQILRDYHHDSLLDAIQNIQFQGYQGQYTDLNILTVDHLDKFPLQQEFMHAYENRCHNLSGVFHGHCLMAGSIATGKKDERLYALGTQFGSALQATNDLGDFMPPTPHATVMEKPYSDQFSDLRQGKLTLPTYLLLTQGTTQQRERMREKVGMTAFTEQDIVQVIDALCTGTFEHCFTYIKSKHKKLKKELYAAFNRSPERDLIAEMFSAIVSNKFVYNLREAVRHAQS